MKKLLASTCIFLGLAGPAAAQDVSTWYFYNEQMDACEIAPVPDFPESSTPDQLHDFLAAHGVQANIKKYLASDGTVWGESIDFTYNNSDYAVAYFTTLPVCNLFKATVDSSAKN